MGKHNEFGVKISATHTKSLVKLRKDPILKNTYQNTSLQTSPKYAKQRMYDCDQKCRLTTRKCTMTMERIVNFLNDAMTPRKE